MNRRIFAGLLAALLCSGLLALPASASVDPRYINPGYAQTAQRIYDIVTSFRAPPAGYDYYMIFSNYDTVQVVGADTPPYGVLWSKSPVVTIGTEVTFYTASNNKIFRSGGGTLQHMSWSPTSTGGYLRIASGKTATSTTATGILGIYMIESTATLSNPPVNKDRVNQFFRYSRMPTVFTELNRMLNLARQRTEENYSTDSWAELAAAVGHGQSILNVAATLQEEVDETCQWIQAALDGLVSIVDLSELQRLLDEADALEKANYTAASWQALQQVISDANTLLANPDRSQAAVNAMSDRLRDALAALVFLDLSELLRLLDEVDAIDPDDYTLTSWQALQRTVTDARALLTDPNRTQDAIDAMSDRLRSAIEALEFLDASELLRLLDEAGAIGQDDYTATSWGALQRTITDARALLINPNRTQAMIDDMSDRLREAMASLAYEAPDFGGLLVVLERAEAIENEGYTTTSWRKLREAIAEGRALTGQSNVRQSQVRAMIAAVNTAIDGLTLRAQPAKPTHPWITQGATEYRYLVDGIPLDDIMPAGDAMMENAGLARTHGFMLFGLLVAVWLIPRILKKFTVGLDERAYLEATQPGGARLLGRSDGKERP